MTDRGLGALRLLGALALLALPSRAFNLDTEHFTRHGAPGTRPSMFGFAVAAHRERGQPWVIIGAPEAQTLQPGVERGGAVYRCDPHRDDACAEVVFDRNGNHNDSAGTQIDQKSNQWFGATISSAGEDGPVVACAPRYVSYAAKSDRRDPVGTCFVSRNGFTEVLEYAPCRTRNWGYHRQGSCQAGLGASVSRDGRRLFIGAPGSWYWQGQAYSINPTIRLPFMPPRHKEYGEGQLYSQSLDVRPSVLSTGESRAVDDDSYLGYSVAVGDFNGSGEQGVAVGMPRGSNLLGKVVLYSWDLQSVQNLTGEQLGGYFGYSLCAADVDGDGLDDLVVGAPMYTPVSNDGKYDVGRLYVIYQQSDQGRFMRVDTRDGSMSKSRFGLSLAALGDINLDGFGDFAVGAPYDGEGGRGAVYVFHGAAGGVREKASQVLRAEAMGQPSLSTFGFSVAGGVDLDSNQYTDLVVGAYEADTAFLFRAKPVVKMTASILFGTESKLISLDEKNCTLYSRRKVACTTINYCLKYDGIGVDTSVEFDLQFVLDTKKPNNPRLFFLNNEGRNTFNQTIPLVRDDMYCNSMQVYIVDDVRDKLTPIEAEVRYGMREEGAAAGRRRNPRAALHPVLDQNAPNVQKDSVNIQKNCGPDNVCIPDLRLMATPSVDKYLLGSKDRLNIDVIVQNMGEDAFETTYNLQLPAGVNYINIERIDGAKDEIPVQCSAPTSFNNNTLKCDIGNPLPQGRLVHFKVLLKPYHKTGMAPSYDFFMEANSTNPENSLSVADNQQSMSIGIWLETDLIVTSKSLPPDLHYNTSLYPQLGNLSHEADIGPQLLHLYGIRNNGPSTIEEAEVFLLWPYETLAGDSLMYVLEQPETNGNIRCELAEHVNDLNLQIDRKRKSYLESYSAAMHGGVSGEATVAGGGAASASAGATSSSSSSTSSSSGGASWSSSSSNNFSRTSTSSGSGFGVLTAEQKKKKEEEERSLGVETGDASRIHAQRAQQAHTTGTTQAGGAGQQWSSSSNQGGTWNSGGQGGATSWNKTNNSGSGTGQNWGPATQGQWSSSQSWGGQQGGTHNWAQGGQQGGPQVWTQGGGSQGGANRGTAVWTQGVQGGSSGRTQGGSQTWSQGSTGNPSQTWTQGGSSATQGGSQTWGHGGSEEKQGGSQEGRQGSGIQGGNHAWSQGTHTESVGRAQEDRDRSQWSTASQGGESRQIGAGGAGGRTGGQQWTWTSQPAGGYNRTYTSSWNSSRVGGGPAVVHHSSHNSSAVQGADGRVVQTEASTEYYTLGAEGEAGSSFSNRIGDEENDRSSNRRVTYSQSSEGQGGATHYGAGSYTSGGARRYDTGERRYSSGYGAGSSQGQGWGDGVDSYSSGGRHKWSTEETVNRELINAGSATFHQDGGSAAGNTFVGAPQSSGPMGAAAAGRGYRVNTWDLGQDTQRVAEGGRDREGAQAQSFSSSYQGQWSAVDSGERARDNVPTDRPQQHFRWDRKAQDKRDTDVYDQEMSADSRRRRSVEGENTEARTRRQAVDINEEQLAEAMRCPGVKCARVRCVAGPLDTDREIWILLRSRINAQTLKKLTFDRSITLTSVAVARVSRLPYLGQPLERPPRSQQASSVLTPLVPPQPPEGVPLWVVVLAAVAGTALLLLLILALYKFGFFKRNRPSDAPERQPLNRNGYGHGDEQL